MEQNIIHKLNKHRDKYVIFYVDGCQYCSDALQLLKKNKLQYRSYNISTIKYVDNDIKKLFELFKQHPNLKFEHEHKTKPIIFKKGKYLGGYSELKKELNK